MRLWGSLSFAVHPAFMPRAVRLIVCAAVFVLSRLGLKNIVGYAYPALGLCGAFFLIMCAAVAGIALRKRTAQ